MNIKTQQQVLFNELCRACLRKSNNMRYMMDTTDETTKTLLTTFSCFLDKELKFNKLYPCYLCPTCEWKLRSSFEFRTLCLKSDQCITTILSQTNLIQSNLVIDVNAAPLPQSNKKSAAGHSQENQLDKGCYVPQTAIFKPTDQQLNNIEPPIKIKDEDTDDDLYYNAGAYDAIDKVEVIEVHDEELHYTDDKTATIPSISNQLTSMNQKKLCTAIKFECQLPWNAKRKTKKIRQRADENPKLKLSRYPREEVQVHIDAIEYKSNQELECLFCKTMCQGQRALCRHVTAAHMDKKSKWCSTCNKQVENLPVHKKDNHQDHLTCPFCDKKLSIVGKYKAHLQRHIVLEEEFRCIRCNVLFQSERNLMIHTRKMHTKEILYSCDSCPQKYKSEVQLHLHHKIHYKQINKECPDCKAKFDTNDQIDRHVCTQQNKVILESYDGLKNFCKLCDKRVRSLDVHYKTYHDPAFSLEKSKKRKTENGNPYLCSTCGKAYKSKFTLTVHMRNHTGIKPFKCKVCDMKMASRTHMKNHERVHTGEKPYICSYCGKRFRTKSTLNYHVQIHTGKSTPCSLCPKRFARPIEMRVHMFSHTGERPYKCDECGQTFTQHCHLVQHRHKHTGERPYKCEFCEKAYPHPHTLRKHVKIVHLGEKFLKCRLCSFECNQWIHLKRHKETNHNMEIATENQEVDSS